MKTVIDGLLLREGSDPQDFSKVCLSQPSSAKRTLNILLQHLAQHLNGLDLESPSSTTLISAAAGVIDAVIKGNDALYNHLVSWCVSSSGAGLGDAVGIRRAVLAVIAQNKDGITTVFEKSLAQFGDQLYIKHAAILQQNGTTCFHHQSRHCCIALTPVSPCRSVATQRRLRCQTVSHQTEDHCEIRLLPDGNLEPDSSNPGKSSILGLSRWRITIDPHGRQESEA